MPSRPLPRSCWRRPSGPRAARRKPPACEVARPIVFAGLDYDSAQFHNAVAKFIVKQVMAAGREIPGDTIPLINGVARGDVDVDHGDLDREPGAGLGRCGQAGGTRWSVGVNFPDATEGWFVPRYVV